MKLKQLFRFGDQRVNYWSCSRLAQWIRKTFAPTSQKPAALEMHEWDEWRDNFRSTHSFVYWLTEDALSWVQDFVNYPFDILSRIRVYCRNRFVDKIHYLPTGLEAGEYYDFDTRLLHGMFEGLADFVEVEKAHMEICWNTKKQDRPWFYRFPVFRWKTIRSRELGMKYLQWETTLDDASQEYPVSSQAECAREIIALYTWWRDVRPNRPDPYEASGWMEHIEQRRSVTGKKTGCFPKGTEEQQEKTRSVLDRISEIEKRYDDEDQEMMIRLIKIRGHLWT